MGRPVLEFVVPEERERAQEHFARMVRGDGPGPGEYHGLRRDGGVFEVEANGEAIRDAQGRPASVVLVVRDITERRRLEQERRQLQARLNQAQKLESLGSLAGGVAHDMNNVLAAILGMVSLHREQAPPGSPLAQGLETITRAAERGGKMVKSLLRLARQNPAEERELDLNAKEVGKSTGLGLSMVYSTVKAHRGQLDIQSEPGKGTLVTLAFPACTAGAQVQAAGTPDRPGPEAEPLAVLLVDDDDLVQDSVRAILEVLGHTVVLASSGEEALTKVEAFRPDVVILDVNMPGLGGSGTLPRLRALLPDVPVLLVTGRADQATHDLAARHSGVTLLAKPFGLRDLQQYLDACGRRDPA
jgi:CheY-like chemotaxis protein